MEYSIKIDNFEGPLDLLLHLIKKLDIDIYDVSINEVIEQYLDYINNMNKLNIDVSSEYLVMASELMLIKSQSLLPNNNDVEELDDDYISKENLINRLVEYEKYKKVTSELKKLELKRKEIYTKAPTNINNITDTKLENKNNLSVDDLVQAFYCFLERIDKEKPIHTKVTSKEYSVKKRKGDIKDYLKKMNNRKISFDELFDIYSKSYVVVTFISILELVKEKEINIEQKDELGNIYIKLNNNY